MTDLRKLLDEVPQSELGQVEHHMIAIGLGIATADALVALRNAAPLILDVLDDFRVLLALTNRDIEALFEEQTGRLPDASLNLLDAHLEASKP